MIMQVCALLKDHERSYLIESKLSEAIDEILTGMDVCPHDEDALKELDEPNFLIISVNTYNLQQLELIEKEHPNSLLYFGKAINYFSNRNKKKNSHDSKNNI